MMRAVIEIMLDALFHKYIRNLTTPIRLYKPSDFIDIVSTEGVRIACGQALYEVDQVTIHLLYHLQFIDVQLAHKMGNNYLVYGYGSNFDIPILEYALNYEGIAVPWHHKQPTCLRTLARFLSESEVSEVEFEGIKHTPFADAQYEAKLLIKVLEKLKRLQ